MTISQQRLEILRNAAETGDIWIFTYSGGPIWVRAGKVDLGDEKDRGDQALYVDEVRAMTRENLVEQRGKDYYRLTGAGFTAAKQALGKINLQEMSTAELVEIIRQQAESWQKPDEAIWNELMVRYRWIGCPKEDSALIGGLDSVLRLLNKGHTMFPPRIRNDPSAGIPPPPLYYQKKISLSQVINRSSVQTTKTSPPEKAEAINPKETERSQNTTTIKQNEFQPPEQIPETFEDVLRKPILKSRFRLPIAIAVVLVCGLYAVYAILPEQVKLEIWNHLVNFFHTRHP